MRNYDQLVNSFLQEFQKLLYSASEYSYHKTCYRAGKEYFGRENVCLNEKEIECFIEKYPARKKSTFRRYFHQLREFYETGVIAPKKERPVLKLNLYYLTYLNNFLISSYENKRTRESVRNNLVRFFVELQKHSLELDKLDYDECIEIYTNLDLPKKGVYRDIFDEHVRKFLKHIHYLQINKRKLWIAFSQYNNKFIFSVDSFSASIKEEIKGISEFHQKELSEVWQAREILPKILEKMNYGINYYRCVRRTLELLYAFFDFNNLKYSIEFSWFWFNEIESKLNRDRATFKRTINIIELYFQDQIQSKRNRVPEKRLFISEKEFSKQIKPKRVFSLFDELTPYYQEMIVSFQSYKRAEFKNEKKLKEYRFPLQNFCFFLMKKRLITLSALTNELISEFYISEYNKGKIYVIRLFLEFLQDKKVISAPLSQCIYFVERKKTKIVNILDSSEIEKIDFYRKKCSKSSEYKNAAVVNLGLLMGLRSSDVMNLKFSDINWEKRILSIVQLKTKVQLNLPIPDAVIDSLLLYIKYSRPNVSSPYIFIESRPPFRKIKPGSCKYMLRAILKNRTNFHILRRTFATNIHSNSSLKSVINCLGHTSETSVSKYVRLAENAMKQCSLSFTDVGISGDIL